MEQKFCTDKGSVWDKRKKLRNQKKFILREPNYFTIEHLELRFLSRNILFFGFSLFISSLALPFPNKYLHRHETSILSELSRLIKLK